MINLKNKINEEGYILSANRLFMHYHERTDECSIDFEIYDDRGFPCNSGCLVYPGYDRHIEEHGENAMYIELYDEYKDFEYSFEELFKYVNEEFKYDEFNSSSKLLGLEDGEELLELCEDIESISMDFVRNIFRLEEK